MRASIRERLQASDTALVEARQNLIGLQGREERHLETISTLKADLMVLRSNPAQDTAALLRIRDLEFTNTALEASIAKVQSDLAQQDNDMKRRDEEATVAKQQLESIKVELEQSKVVIMNLEEEKFECEALAISEKESLSAQYLKTTNAEKAILKKEYSNELTQLRRLKDAAEAKALQSEDRLERLKAEKGSQVSYGFYMFNVCTDQGVERRSKPAKSPDSFLRNPRFRASKISSPTTREAPASDSGS